MQKKQREGVSLYQSHLPSQRLAARDVWRSAESSPEGVVACVRLALHVQALVRGLLARGRVMEGAAWALGLVITAACAGAASAQQLQPGTYPAVDPALYAPLQVVGAPTGAFSSSRCCLHTRNAMFLRGSGRVPRCTLHPPLKQPSDVVALKSTGCASRLCHGPRALRCAMPVLCSGVRSLLSTRVRSSRPGQHRAGLRGERSDIEGAEGLGFQ